MPTLVFWGVEEKKLERFEMNRFPGLFCFFGELLICKQN